MVDNSEKTTKVGYKHPPREHCFKPGQSGNPGGRPKDTLKDYLRHKFTSMTPEEKEKFLKKISPETQFKMAEGNPESQIDNKVEGEIVIKQVNYGVQKQDKS